MSAQRDPYTDLLREITLSIVLDHGFREQIAAPIAESVMTCLQRRKAANNTLYVAAPPRQYDVLQIRAAFERGESIARVCRTFGISRSQVHKLFPGGTPRPAAAVK